MTNFSPYANYGYLALIKESTEGTAITPTNYLRTLAESVVPDYAISPVQEIAGSRERNIRSVPNRIEIGGDVEFYIEPKMIGHFLRSLLGEPTTQTLVAAESFRHTFEVSDTPKTYTVDLSPADAPWAHRFFGVHINKLLVEAEDNKIKCTATLAPRKAFTTARVKTEVNSGTTLTMDQTEGLTTSDSILVLQKAADGEPDGGFTTLEEHTISSVDSATQLTLGEAIAVTLEVDDIVVIKKATESYDQGPVFTWLSGSQPYVGSDIDNTSAVDKEEFNIELNNETEPRWFAGKEEAARFPGAVITKGYAATGQLTKFYDSQANLDRMRKNEKLGVRMLMCAETALGTQAAVKARTYWGTGNGFYVEGSTAGKASNDINVTIVINDTDDLAASISGNNILIELASTTASKNTGTLIAAAVNALSGVDSVAEGTGAEQFTAAVDNQNLGDSISGATAAVVGRDANEASYLEFNFAAAKINSYFPSASEDDILQEEIPFTFYKDVESGQQAKKWSTKIRLVNDVSSY